MSDSSPDHTPICDGEEKLVENENFKLLVNPELRKKSSGFKANSFRDSERKVVPPNKETNFFDTISQ